MALLFAAESSKDIGYSDLLKDVKHLGWFGSIKFSQSIYSPERWKYKVDRNPEEIWKSVLDADRVQWIVSNMAREERRDKQEIIKEACGVLQEMAFKEHLNLVRFFGFTMYHVMNTIYTDGVWYNTDTLKAITEAVREHPVILMPSHRCYMDFLVLSVLSVHLGWPLPAIASGMDFMTMKGIGFLLRSSGAFFMRRSFGSDRLYWALFTEYVHSLIINSDRTIEFFIEGTRSRSGKSFNPKLGLLSVVAEPYLKAQIYDIMIVPVSISYDRILEESLYAYELLGVPKPKESTSGLFKATGILRENYGSLHIHFAKPLSIRKECSHMDRAVHACYPRYMLRLTATEQSYLTELAYKIIQTQQKNMAICLWPLVATFLCQSSSGIQLGVLTKELQWLLDLLRGCGVKVTKVQTDSLIDVIKNVLSRYSHLVEVELESKDPLVTIKGYGSSYRSSARTKQKLTSLSPAVRDGAAIQLMIASYRNQLMHIFVKPALIIAAMSGRKGAVDMHDMAVRENFAFLRELFHKEFIFPPNHLQKDYEEGLEFLCRAGVFTMNGTALIFQERGSKVMSFLAKLMRPFVQCYVMICSYVAEFHHSSELKVLYNSAQMWIAGKVGDHALLLETLSKELISNGIHGIERVGALKFCKEGERKIVHVRRMQAKTIGERIQKLMDGSGSSAATPTYMEQNSKL